MATLAAMGRRQIAADDPRAGDVQALLQRHLEFARATTPPEGVHALDTGGLLDPAVTFFSLRRDDELIAIGALKELDARHGEVKSMHTAAAARGSGAGRAMLAHIIGVAAQRGYERLSLETGSMAAFGPARALYASAGFTLCGPFADYQPSATSTFMTLAVRPGPARPAPLRSGPGTGPGRPADPAAQRQQDQPDNSDYRPGAGPEMAAGH
jgi:putative acetyltransferase